MKTSVPQRLRHDPVLNDAVSQLRRMYGQRLKRAVLYGSRARGDHRRNSDYDIAVFLRGDMGDEITRLGDLNFDLMAKHQEDVVVLPFAMNAWRKDTLLMRHIKRDGIEL
jgi:predicted nucleotidyltransferase